MLFSYKFFTFSRLFSQHPNKFYYKKFQNHSQIPTPHTTKTPIQPTAANSGNQKPQPPKHHYHTTTQQQQKSKSQREIGGLKARSRGGEIEQRDRRWDRSSDWSVRSGLPLNRRTIACDCRTWKRWSGLRRRRWRHDLASSPARSLSLSLSLPLSLRVWPENGLKWKFELQTIFVVKGSFSSSTSNNFRKIYFPCAIKHPELRKSISGSGLKSKQTQPKFIKECKIFFTFYALYMMFCRLWLQFA